MQKSSVWTNPKLWTVIVAAVVNVATIALNIYIKDADLLKLSVAGLTGFDTIAGVFIATYFGTEYVQAQNYRANLQANTTLAEAAEWRQEKHYLASVGKE